MKKLLLSFLLCSWFIGYAQDWNPFPLGQKSFYQEIFNDNAIQVFHCDTVLNRGNIQTYFFSNTEENYSGCFNSIKNQNIQSYFFPFEPYSNYHNFIRPDSMNYFNDTLMLEFILGSGQYNNEIIFLPKTPLHSSWFSAINHYQANYNRLKFTCDSIYLDTIIGNITDSVKLISVKAYNNSTPVVSIFDNQKIILSKNFGYKQLVSFSGQSQYPSAIIGLENNSTQEGFYYPDFTDYFHLNVGDIIIWSEHHDGDITSTYTYFYKDSLIESFVSSDSVYYKFNRQKAFGANSLHYFITNRDKMSWLSNSTAINKNFKSINSYGTYPLHNLSPIFKTNNLYEREYYFNGLDLDTNNCILQGVACIETIERFDTYLGLKYQSFTAYSTTTFNVIGSTISGITQGTPWNMIVTDVKDNTVDSKSISIYPNPSPSGNFTLESEQAKWLEIMSIDGKTVFSQNINQSKTAINTNLPQGLYFVKITFDNNKQTIQKIVF